MEKNQQILLKIFFIYGYFAKIKFLTFSISLSFQKMYLFFITCMQSLLS